MLHVSTTRSLLGCCSQVRHRTMPTSPSSPWAAAAQSESATTHGRQSVVGQSAKQKVPVARVPPAMIRESAQSKVFKLEQVLELMSGCAGPVVDVPLCRSCCRSRETMVGRDCPIPRNVSQIPRRRSATAHAWASPIGLAEEVAELACLQRRQSVRIVSVGQGTASEPVETMR